MIRSHLSHIWHIWLNLILPPRSLISHTPHISGIEPDLWVKIHFIDEPCCHICGFPFELDPGFPKALCGTCTVHPPTLRHIRSALVYDDISRRLLIDFKHNGHMSGLDIFARKMLRAGRSLLQDADYIIPVPLHYRRNIARRYNQSALLARALIRQLKNVPHRSPKFDPNILLRHRSTPSQAGKNAHARYKNVHGAFHVPKKAQPRIKGAHILLIDDVMTTGATFETCARTLKQAGAGPVDGLSLSRVLKTLPLNLSHR